jgi:oxygen-dependent protoporphyrinogen oxidase
VKDADDSRVGNGGRPRRIAVVGAGISGLTAAYELQQAARGNAAAGRKAPVEVTLFEAGPRFGGVVQTARDESLGLTLEEGPDCFVSTKPAAMELARELGLGDELIGTRAENRRSFILHRGKLRPIPPGFFLLAPTSLKALAATPLLSMQGKLRAALDLFMPAFSGLPGGRPENPATHDESLASFVRRRFGEEVLERIAQPMVGGIYTADPEKLSLAATFPQFLAMERTRGSVVRALMAQQGKGAGGAAGAKSGDAAARVEGAGQAAGPRYGMFVSLKSGMGALPAAVAAALAPGTLRLNTAIIASEQMPAASAAQRGGWRLRTSSGETVEFDALCLALPAHASAKLLAATDPQLAGAIGSVEYASCAIVNLAWPRSAVAAPMDGMGFVVPHIEHREILACSFSAMKWAHRAPPDTALFRVFMGGAMQEHLCELDDRALLATATKELTAILGISGPPLLGRVARWPKAMAQYHVGHIALEARIRALESAHPTLALAGNAFDGVGIPDCIRQARAAAARLLAA